jgi:predicted RNA-binding protein with PIN domain
MPPPVPAKLEDQRQCLVRYIENHRPQGSLNNPVTIVFDGQAGIGSGVRAQPVSVVFSQDETADDLIRKMVAGSSVKKSTVVVTDDRQVQISCRALGANIQSVSAFMRFPKAGSRPAKGRPRRNTADPVKPISRQEEDRINAELAKIWLHPPDKQP